MVNLLKPKVVKAIGFSIKLKSNFLIQIIMQTKNDTNAMYKEFQRTSLNF